MSTTDFGSQQPQKRRAWQHASYKHFRDNFFFDKWMGQGDGCIVEHVTELTNTDKGTATAMIHLIADLFDGGVTGDNQLEGRESSLQSYWQEITVDQLRKAVKNKGRMADQRSVIQFRSPAKDKLGRWMAETMEEQLVHTASGISFAQRLNGSVRVAPNGEDDWTTLDYAADVSAPTANRSFRFDGTNLLAGDTTLTAAGHVLKYGALVDIAAQARNQRIKPVRKGGQDWYMFCVHPLTMARLWKDPDFRTAIVNADVRGEDNKFFAGGKVTIDGLCITPYQKVYNTSGAISGSKWGSGGTVDGTRSLLLGAQALAMADLRLPEWDEKEFDFGNQQGIAISKIMGMLKPKFFSPFSQTTEDFGVMTLDSAL